jgi:DtxR family Mn-dependent transcriptional regulator
MDKNKKLTSNMEDYLEAILLIKQDKKVTRVRDIADSLDVKRSSVTAALNSLTDMGYVTHEKYGYVDLTDSGEEIAADVLKRHELLVSFLHTILGIDKETACKEACELEHAISAQTFQKLSRFIARCNIESHRKGDLS